MSNYRMRTAIAIGTTLAALFGAPAFDTRATAASKESGLQLVMMDEMQSRMGNKGGMSGGMQQREMGGMGGMSGGMQQREMGGMGGMSGGMQQREMGGMGAGPMGMAPGSGSSMTMTSALPGFPGASHLYHVGATGFFLDYADKLTFSVEQTGSLNGIKQRALTEQSSSQRKIDEAEQAFWLITASDQPDINAVDTKLREIEKLRSDMRLAFIRAVGEAAKVLSADQRKMVLGLTPMPTTSSGTATK